MTIMTVVKRPREGRRPALRERTGVAGAEEVIIGNPKPMSGTEKATLR
jgi:hypothetical protein